jgi:hypothetical protein
MELYPDKFIPFLMPPDNDGSPDGFPTVNSEVLNEMLEIEPGLFKGYGEIGLYARNGGGPELHPPTLTGFRRFILSLGKTDWLCTSI